jgi:carbon monoxide dehydrogenase subunit G
MSSRTVDVSTQIDNTPEAVLAYIADVRNRQYYLPALKSITDIKDAGNYGAGTSWKWTWQALGMEFTGTAECLKYEPGKLYSFRTEGGMASTWTYRAEPEGGGTKLSIHVEYEVPEGLLARIRGAGDAAQMEKDVSEQVLQRLKTVLDR